MRRMIPLLILTCLGAVAEEVEEPIELPPLALRAIRTHTKSVTDAQNSFIDRVERADASLIRTLEAELKKAVRGKRAGMAQAIRLKIDEVKERDKLAAAFITEELKGPTRRPGGTKPVAGENEMVVSANSPRKLGPVQAGDMIVVEYVRGVWSPKGGDMKSPDLEKVDSQCRAAIWSKLGDKWSKLAIVGGNTANSAWTYEFVVPKTAVYIGINDKPNDADNVGEVIFRVQIVKK